MYKLTTKIMADFRVYRSSTLAPIGRMFLKWGVTANIMTTFSLGFGLLSAYYLFSQYILFLLLAVLHLLADAFDGVIARESSATSLGKYYDWFVDQLITVIIIVKLGWFLEDYYAYSAAGLYAAAQLIYFATKGKAPILFTRTLTFICVSTSFIYLYSFAYIITGIASIYTLILQARYFIKYYPGKKIID